MANLDWRRNLSTSAVLDVHDIESSERVHGAEHVRAGRLVADGEIEGANFIVAVLAAARLNVVQSGIVVKPGAGRAANVGVDGVGSHERELAIGCLDDAGAFTHGSDLVLSRDTSTHSGLLCGADTNVEVVPSIVANIECTARGVDLQKVDSAPIRSDTHAEVVAVRLHRPVSDAVDVDEAA